MADLRGVMRLARDFRAGRVGARRAGRRRAGVRRPGASGSPRSASSRTLAYALLYVLLRGELAAQETNAVALLLTAVANTAANRRLTFGDPRCRATVRHQIQGLAVFGLALALTSSALGLLELVSPRSPRTVELEVLVTANLLATVLRFVLLRSWVFRARRAAPGEAGS